MRLLRSAGCVVLHGVLGARRASTRTPPTRARSRLREVARQVREDDRLAPLLLPLGDGLLAAVKTRRERRYRAVTPLPSTTTPPWLTV